MTKQWGGVGVSVLKYANVFKVRLRSEVERIDCVLHEIRKTCVTLSTLVWHHQHTQRKIPELHIPLHHQVCHLRSHRTVRKKKEEEVTRSVLSPCNTRSSTSQDSPSQTWRHTSQTPTSLSWSNAAPNRTPVLWLPQRAAWITLEKKYTSIILETVFWMWVCLKREV